LFNDLRTRINLNYTPNFSS